jgi:hypothetical protein
MALVGLVRRRLGVAPIMSRLLPTLEGCALASILNRDPRAHVVAYGNPNAFGLLIDVNVVGVSRARTNTLRWRSPHMVQCLLAAMILRIAPDRFKGLWKDRDAKQAHDPRLHRVRIAPPSRPIVPLGKSGLRLTWRTPRREAGFPSVYGGSSIYGGSHRRRLRSRRRCPRLTRGRRPIG